MGYFWGTKFVIKSVNIPSFLARNSNLIIYMIEILSNKISVKINFFQKQFYKSREKYFVNQINNE